MSGNHERCTSAPRTHASVDDGVKAAGLGIFVQRVEGLVVDEAKVGVDGEDRRAGRRLVRKRKGYVARRAAHRVRVRSIFLQARHEAGAPVGLVRIERLADAVGRHTRGRLRADGRVRDGLRR